MSLALGSPLWSFCYLVVLIGLTGYGLHRCCVISSSSDSITALVPASYRDHLGVLLRLFPLECRIHTPMDVALNSLRLLHPLQSFARDMKIIAETL
jgi:hypothetical protein